MLARNTLAVAAMLAMHVKTSAGQSLWTDTFVMYNGGTFDGSYPFLAEDPNRQHLHYALPPGFDAENDDPAPVFFFAHGNGGTAAGMPNKEIGLIRNQGYALVSWESVTAIRNADQYPEGAAIDFATCVQDLDLVTEWVMTNGPALGLSTTNWTISGRSRGSVISWIKAHSNLPQIQSAYFYNALPSPNITGQLALIDENSPPMYLAYGPSCPEPIIIEGPETCVSFKTELPSDCDLDSNGNPVPTDPQCVDIHNPISGVKIVNRYNELGKGDQVDFAQGYEENYPGTQFNIFRGLPTLLEIVANSSLTTSPSEAPTFGPPTSTPSPSTPSPSTPSPSTPSPSTPSPTTLSPTTPVTSGSSESASKLVIIGGASAAGILLVVLSAILLCQSKKNPQTSPPDAKAVKTVAPENII